MGDNQWAYGRRHGTSDSEYLAWRKAWEKQFQEDIKKPTFWDERSTWMEKHEWPEMNYSHADIDLEERYEDWSDKELISTAGYFLEERSKVLEEDLKRIKAIASSLLSELERRQRMRPKRNIEETNKLKEEAKNVHKNNDTEG